MVAFQRRVVSPDGPAALLNYRVGLGYVVAGKGL
jgi:hypothetical protein